MISEAADQGNFESGQSLRHRPQYRNSGTIRQVQQAGDKGRGDDSNKNARYALVAFEQKDDRQRSATNRKRGPIDTAGENPFAYRQQIAYRPAPFN